VNSRDTNHARSAQFIADHLVGNCQLLVSLLVLDEAIWKIIQWALGGRGLALAPLLKRNPRLLAPQLPRVRQIIDYVLGWATLTGPGVGTHQVVLDDWFDRMADLGQVHDALHVALAVNSGARSLATADTGFRLLAGKGLPIQVIEV
jgi:hypothetical protein